ncbi:uncharacterized protein BDR25DRAFT_345960 [Lindgomyces ingoldianus]|uniref:Uncharacterized protein n=1 Tax=Lindgomyces ingoldianus TaxID=673940 RepID=A0ACB6QI71_9PLEO|nr:uncharacterized protein BDR25DRAFT_345960 [Lindgomyces ingoldianus]KAF2465802.1 hypothetical protein BDR25DRAFT_345960 [Lindgomyces ingoldianus]
MFTQQSVCNLRVMLPQPPWTKSFNWNLHITLDGEERIPFHLLRIEAAKLFWADPNTYYLVESHWLLEGGYPGGTCYDLPFLAHVQNVEVEYQHGSDNRIGPLHDGIRDIRQDVVRNFWNTLKKRFPRVRRAVINQNWESLSDKDYNKPAFPCLKILVESCPLKIDVSAFVLEEASSLPENTTITLPTNKWQRSLYRPTLDGEWRKVAPCFNRKTILMPMKRFHGPVGEFEKLRYLRNRLALQHFALGPLVIEALDRHHFDEGRQEPFLCPESGCNAYFEKAGQWTMHAIETHNVPSIKEKRFDILPNKLRDAFERHESDLERKREEVAGESRRMFNEWNEEGGEKRRDIERGWMDQLENEEAWDTGTEARESELWKFFTMVMNPTWCGQ